MDKLKPCPFCGGIPEITLYRCTWYVQCECGCELWGEYAEEEMIEKWNRRAGEVDVPES